MEHRVGWLDPVFAGLSYLGTVGLVWIALAIVAALVSRRPLLFPLVALAVIVADVAALALKHWVEVERPYVRYPETDVLVRAPTDPSFPSGHAATSFASAATLSPAVPRLALPLYLLAAAIAFSRVYVGAHYPLDIVAGAGLGLAVATALRLLGATRRRSQQARRRG